MTCDVVSCAVCTNFGLHKGHVHELGTTVADGHRSQLQKHMRAAEAADVEAAEAARAAEQVIHQISAEPSPVTSDGTRASAKQKIMQAFRTFREALDAPEQELIAKVDSLADEKLTAATKQLNVRFVLSTIASFGFVDGPGAPLEAHCELQGSTTVVTWQPPASSALRVMAHVVQRAVGEAGRYTPTGRTNGARLEQRVDDLAGQSLRYRVQVEDEGGNVGAWVQSPSVQLAETFGIELRFQSPFDENGVLHHIGTAGGQREYQNPHNTGDVVASMSSIYNSSGTFSCSPAHFVQHTHAVVWELSITSDQPFSWMAVDLLN